jgi:EAL domain-containing protein (putative c-di-GMP-specific phosphodiesterase class I)
MSAPTSSPVPVPTSSPARGRVLIVDDEPALLRLLARILTDAGYGAETAGDGAAASALLRDRQFDVILSDVHMPGLDGIELLRVVRERDLDVPVILLTGAPDVETAARALEYGAFRYLIKKKAVDSEALVKVVQEASRLHEVARLKRAVLELRGGAWKQPADRVGLEASLDRALGTLWMAFQPIVSIERSTVLAYEALLRSDEPTLPNPTVLVDAAERTGRLTELGRIIRAAVAAQVEAAPADLIFVNLHPRELLDEQLCDPDAPLSRHAGRVVLEVTERAALEEVEGLTARVARLRELGYRMALDDLGAGYAGLSSLARLEPEFVKLDMSLIRDIHRQPVQQKLVRSVVSMCHDMGKHPIAEGVESAEELAVLRACGCDLLQGYFFARPGRPFPTPRYG